MEHEILGQLIFYSTLGTTLEKSKHRKESERLRENIKNFLPLRLESEAFFFEDTKIEFDKKI